MGPMRRTLQKLVREQHGSVLMLTGLAILILFAVAGAGVDFGRQQLVRMKLQNASDAAAVAAASLKNATVAEREAIALRYYNLNYPQSFLGVERPDPEIIIGDTISVEASTVLMANFISNVGVQRLEAEGRTVVSASADEEQAQDVILVMDNSGSMAYQTSAPSFAQTDVARARITTVPVCRNQQQPFYDLECPTKFTALGYSNSGLCFSQGATDFCRAFQNSAIPRGAAVASYGFVGNSRLNALRSVANTFVDTLLVQGNPENRMGIITWNEGVTDERRLTDDETLIRTDLADMGAFGATNPYAAMQKAVDLARDFETGHVKAIVLLTDGKPTYADATGMPIYKNMPGEPWAILQDIHGCDGRISSFCQSAVDLTNTVCSQLKNDGIIIYTIGFGLTVGPDLNASERQRAINFLSNCASINGEGNPRFFDAPDGATLEEAFKQITTQLGKLRIRE